MNQQPSRDVAHLAHLDGIIADIESEAATTATAINYERCRMELAHHMMAEMTDLGRAQAIARHYISLATFAKALMEICRLREHHCTPGEEAPIDAIIQRMMDDISQAHRHDLGIDLEWRKQQSDRAAATKTGEA